MHHSTTTGARTTPVDTRSFLESRREGGRLRSCFPRTSRLGRRSKTEVCGWLHLTDALALARCLSLRPTGLGGDLGCWLLHHWTTHGCVLGPWSAAPCSEYLVWCCPSHRYPSELGSDWLCVAVSAALRCAPSVALLLQVQPAGVQTPQRLHMSVYACMPTVYL